MLCPLCLTDVIDFICEKTEKRTRSYTCPACGEGIPLRYVLDYHQYEPLIFCTVGLAGHGKTVYLGSVLIAFKHLCRHIDTFSFTPLDDQGMYTIREKQKALEEGRLPQSTPKIFPKPLIIRLDGMEDGKKYHLILFDLPGEVLSTPDEIGEYCAFLGKSPSITWLLSLHDIGAMKPEDFITVYVQAMLQLGYKPRRQRLLVVLTKGDDMLSELPEEVCDFLRGAGEGERRGLSTATERWLEAQDEYRVFVRRAREEFSEVAYCVVSALGSRPDRDVQTVSVNPRGVLEPLEWIRRFPRYRRQAHFSFKDRIGALLAGLLVSIPAVYVSLTSLASGSLNAFCNQLTVPQWMPSYRADLMLRLLILLMTAVPLGTVLIDFLIFLVMKRRGGIIFNRAEIARSVLGACCAGLLLLGGIFLAVGSLAGDARSTAEAAKRTMLSEVVEKEKERGLLWDCYVRKSENKEMPNYPSVESDKTYANRFLKSAWLQSKEALLKELEADMERASRDLSLDVPFPILRGKGELILGAKCGPMGPGAYREEVIPLSLSLFENEIYYSPDPNRGEKRDYLNLPRLYSLAGRWSFFLALSSIALYALFVFYGTSIYRALLGRLSRRRGRPPAPGR